MSCTAAGAASQHTCTMPTLVSGLGQRPDRPISSNLGSENFGACSDTSAVSTAQPTTTATKQEWVYCTFISTWLGLRSLNKSAHQLKSLPHLLEFCVFLCGYAMNPVILPLWFLIVHYNERAAASHHLLPAVSYLGTVLLTLVATELCKRLFSTRRPENTPGAKSGLVRRYGALVSSLKSKHSFPSGDSAAAANLCFFILQYAPAMTRWCPQVVWFAFLVFLPGVWFARVFYLCHWLEDCLGGTLLAAVIHWTIVPVLHRAIESNIGYFVPIVPWNSQ